MHHPLVASLSAAVLNGDLLNEGQGRALAALDDAHTVSLLFAAHTVARHFGRAPFSCSIVNAKSGACSQDCRFCAQSSRYATHAPSHPLLSLQELIDRGMAMHAAGASCYSMVTSGLRLTDAEIDRVCRCAEYLLRHTGLTISASLGLLDSAQAGRLARAGLTRYHHNLETARSHFPEICTTHSYEEDVDTLRTAREHGLEICSGGIFGLGETFDQRIELAATLADLNVNVVPVNFLNPIPGTPLEKSPLLTPHDALKSVALFRLMLPRADITIAGGRETVLGDYLSWLPLAGANGVMIGNYLTTAGRSLDKDMRMLEQGQWIWS